jgi:hypothetical protein
MAGNGPFYLPTIPIRIGERIFHILLGMTSTYPHKATVQSVLTIVNTLWAHPAD